MLAVIVAHGLVVDKKTDPHPSPWTRQMYINIAVLSIVIDQNCIFKR